MNTATPKSSATVVLSPGFSLIELMIALVLGALVVGATIGIFATNRQTYIAVENVARIQENGRTAFEIMSRDIREAGGNACDKDVAVAVVLNGAGSNWWNNWNNPVLGFENGALAGSAAGTDAVQLMSGSASTYTVATHTTGAALLTLNTNHDFVANDVLMVCDQNRATIFQASAVGANTVSHGTGGGSPGNCSSGLGFPVCASATGTIYSYTPNSQITRLSAAQWYVADNGRGTRSLFRRSLRNNGTAQVEEIAEGVRDMQVTYFIFNGTQYLAANAVTAADWPAVRAVRVVLTIDGTENIGTNGARISRTVSNTTALRNRNG